MGWAEASMEAPIRDHIGVGPRAGKEAPLHEAKGCESKGTHYAEATLKGGKGRNPEGSIRLPPRFVGE